MCSHPRCRGKHFRERRPTGLPVGLRGLEPTGKARRGKASPPVENAPEREGRRTLNSRRIA